MCSSNGKGSCLLFIVLAALAAGVGAASCRTGGGGGGSGGGDENQPANDNQANDNGDDATDNSPEPPANDNAATADGGQGEEPLPALGDPGAARVFFSDLTSGPADGGENGDGVFVTLYGNGFGESRGESFVTIGGAEAAAYPVWTNTRVTVQLGTDARSGTLVVHSDAGESNEVAFTVRPGNIFCVSTHGDDDGSGAFGDCWATLTHAVETVAPGDTVYALDGVSAVTEHLAEAALAPETEGTADAPIALVAYPGAVATIGDPETLPYGLRVVPPVGVSTSYWVVAGLRLRGGFSAVDLGGDGAAGWRVIGNDISCPDGDGPTGCFAASLATDLKFLGNEVHDSGIPGASKQYHAVYFTTDSNHIEVGWNHIHDNNTCRAIQFHSSPLCLPDCGETDTTGFNQFDLIVHDNVIHGDVCDGIIFATVDPSLGPVEAFNNLIYDVGRGPDPPDGGASYAGIAVPGYLNNGPEGTGVVEIYNNTIYDCGARGGAAAGAVARGEYSPELLVQLRNNIVVQADGRSYITEESDLSLVLGADNLWSGNGAGPAGLADNLDADPGFMNLEALDFRLLPGSPAIDAGIDTGLVWDLTGVLRPQGAAVDLGAFEFQPE